MIVFLLAFFAILSHASEINLLPKAYFDSVKGEMVYGKVIQIKDDKIIGITDPKNVKNIVAIKDTYFLPGLIDCHSHVLFTQKKGETEFETALFREANLGSKERIERGKDFLRDYLKGGFTTLCDLGNSGRFLDVQLRDQIKNNSRYPLLYVSGPGIATSKGQFPENANNEVVQREYTIVDKKSDPDKLLQSYLNQKVDILKIYMDNSPGIGGMDEDLLKEILKNPKIKNFKKVTFHASSKSSFEMAQRIGAINLEHANQMAIEMDKNSKIRYITPTDQDMETLKEFSYYRKPFYEYQSQRLKEIYKKNIKLVFGPDFYFHHLGAFNRASYVKRTLKTYVEAGIPNKDILRALTINPASSLHEEEKIGVVKVGAFANLVGFKRNPLEDVNVLLEDPMVINRGEWLRESN